MARSRKKQSSSEGDARRSLPSVGVALEHPGVAALSERFSRALTVEAVREALDILRGKMADGAEAPGLDAVAALTEARLMIHESQRLRPVVNATGIILHTGLGRAVLPTAAARALSGVDRCCNLQIDMDGGLRGKRNYVSERLLCKLTGAEAAMIVNNNAAATMLILAALVAGREAVVSRGQLIEIGGSYRLPDCIAASGARMVEVGTTNKTHLRDYEAQLREETGALLHVNPSNYRIVGFSQSVSIEEMVTLKQDRPGLLVIDDLGCGALYDLSVFGLPHEPTVQDSIAAGADLCCFSGDKLIGGPQAGIIVGRRDLIAKIRKHPLTRMLRVGKLTDMALQETLRLFFHPERLIAENPALRMLAMKPGTILARAEKLKARLDKAVNKGMSVDIVEGASATGGGSLPATPIPTWLLKIKMTGRSSARLCRELRRCEPPVVVRVEDDAVTLDLRTIFEDEEQIVFDALIRVGR